MDVTQHQSVAILGSTGSIGTNTLDVIGRHPSRYSIHTLSANTNVDELFVQCKRFNPVYAVMQSEAAAETLQRRLKADGLDVEVLQGEAALCDCVSHADVDTVVAAIVGAAGLVPTLAAAQSGKRLVLANKEALVMSGQLLMQAADASGALIMPTDSEHNAIFQCLADHSLSKSDAGIEKIVLTGSGGPLRNCSIDELRVVTPQQALKHPNWNMGPKISIDSASLMNKGLEVIEACILFSVGLEDIEVLIHPQSVVHSMVRYCDGSVLAQLGRPDMRTPIAHALAWPNRIDSGVQPLDFTDMAALEFSEPDTTRFPCLRLAFEAYRAGGTAPTVLNAANEVAVDGFLNGFVSFLQLAEIVEKTLSQTKISTAGDLTTIIEADRDARILAQSNLEKLRS